MGDVAQVAADTAEEVTDHVAHLADERAVGVVDHRQAPDRRPGGRIGRHAPSASDGGLVDGRAGQVGQPIADAGEGGELGVEGRQAPLGHQRRVGGVRGVGVEGVGHGLEVGPVGRHPAPLLVDHRLEPLGGDEGAEHEAEGQVVAVDGGRDGLLGRPPRQPALALGRQPPHPPGAAAGALGVAAGHQATRGQPVELGVDLAHGRSGEEEPQGGVGPGPQLVARRLAKGQQAQHRGARGRQLEGRCHRGTLATTGAMLFRSGTTGPGDLRLTPLTSSVLEVIRSPTTTDEMAPARRSSPGHSVGNPTPSPTTTCHHEAPDGSPRPHPQS